MNADFLFALIQIPLAMYTAILYGRQYARHPGLNSKKRLMWLAIASVACGTAAWRISTISQIIVPEYRMAGGMLVQTVYQFLVLFAYVLLKENGDRKT